MSSKSDEVFRQLVKRPRCKSKRPEGSNASFGLDSLQHKVSTASSYSGSCMN